ncbi:hypothetical protein N2152v2_002626 [Parachlorella kessleri]
MGTPARSVACLIVVLPVGVRRWLDRRDGRVHTLTLSLWEAPSLLPLVYGAAYAAAASLEQLSIVMEGEGDYPVHLDSLLRLLPNLTKLAVSAARIVVGTDLCNASSLRKLALHADIFEGMWLSDGRRGEHDLFHDGHEPPSPGAGPRVSSLPPSLMKLSFGCQLNEVSPPINYNAGLPYGLDLASTLQGLAVEGRRLEDKDIEILARLSALRELHLTRCRFGSLHHISALTGLKLLYLSGSHLQSLPAAEWEGALAPLRQLVFLSISECDLYYLPPAVAAATCLEGLHVEGNCIAALPPGPYLAHLKELALGWQSLFASHGTLAQHAARLTHLYMAGSHSAARASTGPAPVTAAGREDLVDATLDSISALPELRCFTHVLDEREASGLESRSWLPLCVALCLLRLGRRCPGLQLDAIRGDNYGWSIEDLGVCQVANL